MLCVFTVYGVSLSANECCVLDRLIEPKEGEWLVPVYGEPRADDAAVARSTAARPGGPRAEVKLVS